MKWFRIRLRETLRDIVAQLDLYRDRIFPRLYLRETVSDAGAKLELYGNRLGGNRRSTLERYTWIGSVLALLILVPLALQAWLVYRYGSNIPVADEWSYLPYVRRLMEGGDWWNYLFHQDSENRYAVMRLMMAALVPLTRWNIVTELYAGLIPTALALVGVWLIYRRAGNRSIWLFLPAAGLLIHASQFANFLHAIQFGYLSMVAFAVWTAFLLQRDSRLTFVAAIACAVLGSFSAAGGLIIWVAGLGQLALQRSRWQTFVTWVVSAAVVYAGYLYNFNSQNTGSTLANGIAAPRALLGFFGALIGAVLGANQILWARLVTFVVLLVLAGLIVATLRTRKLPPAHESAAWGLVLFGFLTGALITIGRAELGLEEALLSRYISITTLAVVGTYILLVTRVSTTQYVGALNWLVAPMLLGLIVATNFVGWQNTRLWATSYGRMNQFILQNRRIQPPSAMESVKAAKKIRATIERNLPYMRRTQLSFFNEPVRWWLILPEAHGEELEPIADKAVVKQQFVCPVETLYDLSVIVVKQKEENSAPLNMTLADVDTKQVLATRLAATYPLNKQGRLTLQLPTPIRNCFDRRLRLELSSPSNTPKKNAATVLAYPKFYRGRLSQSSQELTNQSLGMELNTAAFDIVR